MQSFHCFYDPICHLIHASLIFICNDSWPFVFFVLYQWRTEGGSVLEFIMIIIYTANDDLWIRINQEGTRVSSFFKI